MSEPKVLVWLLMEQDGGVLLAHLKPAEAPFAGEWVLPGDVMRAEESSTETVWRVCRDLLDVTAIHETFVDTLYIKYGGTEYAINVFSLAFMGSPRFRPSGPYAEVRWFATSGLPKPINASLSVLLQQEGGRPPRVAKSQDATGTGTAT